MIAIATLLVALPAGFFLRDRLAAFVTYIAVFAYCFTLQGMYLLPVFTREAAPDEWPNVADTWFPLPYFAVTVVVYALGFGLVMLGHRLGSGRRARRAQRPGITTEAQPSGAGR